MEIASDVSGPENVESRRENEVEMSEVHLGTDEATPQTGPGYNFIVDI